MNKIRIEETSTSLSSLHLKTTLITGGIYTGLKLFQYIRSKKIPETKEIKKVIKELKFEASYLGSYIFSEVIREAVMKRNREEREITGDEIEEIIKIHVNKKIYKEKFSKRKMKILEKHNMKFSQFECYIMFREKSIVEDYRSIERFNLDEIFKKYRDVDFRFPPYWTQEKVLEIFFSNDMRHLISLFKYLKKV